MEVYENSSSLSAMLKSISHLLCHFVFATFISTALAQTPPSASQIAKYEGLHKAAHFNNLDQIKRLIETKADLNARDGNGRMPAHVAGFASNEEALQLLAKAGADMNLLDNDLYDVVTIAAVADDPEMLSAAIEAGNRADLTTSIYDGTALIAAAHLGHDEVVRRLIKAGAPLDHINNLHWTALIEAVVLGDGGIRHVETARALVEAGADISIGDRNGITALEHAQKRGYDEMVKVIQSAE